MCCALRKCELHILLFLKCALSDWTVVFYRESWETLVDVVGVVAAEPVSDVVIKSNLPEAIEHNSTVALNCSSKGSFLMFTWLNGSAPIVADGKRLTTQKVSGG